MGRFIERSNNWKTGKELYFFANFIQNHRSMVSDSDVFSPVADLTTSQELRQLVSSSFEPEVVELMQKRPHHRARLDFDDGPREILKTIWNNEFARPRMRRMLRGFVDRHLEQYPLDQYADELFARRCEELKKTLTLNDFEMDVLLVLAFVGSGRFGLGDAINRRSDEYDKAAFVAKCLDCDSSEVLAALDEKAKLRRYNCVDSDFDFNGALTSFLNGVRNEPISSCFFRLCRDEALPWDFYGDLAKTHGDILKRIIRSADGKSPVNILLYGAPGTGKTSFARTLAAELDRKCYLITQNVRSIRGPETVSSPAFRFGALQVCDGQVDPVRSLIVVDEADDMLRGSDGGLFALFGGARPVGDKGLLNNVLDNVTTPTIWITNTAAGELDESSRRRFDYSIRFDALNAEQRLSIWRNNVKKLKLSKLVSAAMTRKFAERYQVSAGGITMTLQNLAKLAPAPGEVETLVETLMKPHCELLGVPDVADETMRPAADYSLEGLNIKGSIPLDRIVEAVRRFRDGADGGIDRPRMNILLSGAPGTGKTEFVKYLGSQLGAKVVVKMGSDLLDMFVGGTEKLIRQAFARAEEEKAILFLDEIDGMVQSRERAHRNWEISQVNELLHQMENFKGVMIGATNFSANLDAAVLRRFTFKLEFDYLDEAGKKLFFERMFDTKLNAREAARLAEIPRLAPGDFRTVRQSFFYLGSGATNAERLEALERESAAKIANRFADRRAVGF